MCLFCYWIQTNKLCTGKSSKMLYHANSLIWTAFYCISFFCLVHSCKQKVFLNCITVKTIAWNTDNGRPMCLFCYRIQNIKLCSGKSSKMFYHAGTLIWRAFYCMSFFLSHTFLKQKGFLNCIIVKTIAWNTENGRPNVPILLLNT